MCDYKITSYVKVNNNNYLVDTCWVPEGCFETMVFPANENNQVTSFLELYAEQYLTWSSAFEGHCHVIDPTEIEKLVQGYL